MRLVVAALSARWLAESARGAGHDVIALDVFGDRDTRAASIEWRSIGTGGLHVDASRLCEALRGLDAVGWIAGAGIEPHLAAAAAAAPASLPLLGNTPEAVAAVRHAPTFFAALDALGIDHPMTRFDSPADADGWLSKDFAGSGGWHVQRAKPATAGAASAATHYWQREQDGQPLSAAFVADRHRAHLLGVQRQLVRPIAGRPYVFCGVIGPIAIGASVRHSVERIVAALVARFALRGLGSVDFLFDDGDNLQVLEVNPRPTAGCALCERGGSMVRAQLAACRGDAAPAGALPLDGKPLRGIEIVYAERDASVDPARLPAAPWCHDVPHEALRVARGDPICSVSAAAASERQVVEELAERRHDVLSLLELCE